MGRHYKYSVDFLPSGDVHLRFDGNFTTATGSKIFEILASDKTKGPSARRKTPAKRTGKLPA
jgi:hypothetical protein